MYNGAGVVEFFFVRLVTKRFKRLANTFVSFFCCVYAWLRSFVFLGCWKLSTLLQPPTITTKIYILRQYILLIIDKECG